MTIHDNLVKELSSVKTELHDANRYCVNQTKLYKDMDKQLSSSVASKSNIVLRLLDLPWDEHDWGMSDHSRHLLESHRSLCRMMMNLSTFSFDRFNDGVKDFINNLDEFFSDCISSRNTGFTGDLNGVSKWPHENSRILKAIGFSIDAKGGVRSVTLRDYVESYVSVKPLCLPILILFLVAFDHFNG